MQFGLNQDQQILQSSGREFFASECPSREVRRLAESASGYDPALWFKMAEQGFTGIIFSPEYGGAGLGTVELILLMEEAGRALLPGPLFSTVVAGCVLDATASPEQKKKYLAPICRGDARATLAILEGSASWDPEHARIAEAEGTITGEKLFVSDAAVADFIVVVADGGIFVVEVKSSCVRITPTETIDLTRKLYEIQFTRAPVEALENPSGLARALDMVATALSAEMVGGMQYMLDVTVDYAKTRKQFGKPVGMFQAIQHQCADMYIETESSRSAAYYAAWALEEDTEDAALAASIAKMYASDAGRQIGNRAIQIHGGMGFTWENDLHLYYRRAKSSETAFGDPTFHRERIARQVIDAQAQVARIE
jgi:alkylation response protein AidB-like acyl-CoA dehydrogenase